MKHDRLRGFLVSAAVSALIGLGCAGCFVTGFQLPLERGGLVTAVILLASAACSACFPRRRGGVLILCIAALISGYLWHEGTAGEQLRQLISRISHVYNNAYGWGELSLAAGGNRYADLPVAILGCTAAMGTGWAMCRRKGSAWGLIPGLLPLGLCMVVTDTVPQTADLLTLLGGSLLLLLTGSVRKESTAQSSRLAVRAAVPAAAFLALLVLAIPKEGYVNHSQELRDTLVRFAEDFPKGVRQTVVELAATQEKVDLAALGPQGSQKLPVLEARWNGTGAVYLRGQDYDRYTGTGWESTPDRKEVFSGTGKALGEVGVRTLTGSFGMAYLPYYPGTETVLSDGKLINENRERVYTVPRMEEGAPVELEDATEYLSLPDASAERLKTLLQEVLPESAGDGETARAIAAYVRGSARYDRETGRMPKGETDFALWFLENAETGYCVHFATAAAVLLRAAGIPSRYVTGYLAQCQENRWSTVTLDQAHAWVEYYDRQAGCWNLLEATPADMNREETVPTEETQAHDRATEETRQMTVEAATAAETAPRETVRTEETAETGQDYSRLLSVGKGILLAALAAALGYLQRTVRLYRRHRGRSTGSTNRRALALWREAEQMGALLKKKPPEALRLAAQKAKFSQYTLNEEELAPFTAYLSGCRRQLKQAPWYCRLYYRWILAIY